MAREPRDGGADIDAVYASGVSGNYPNPYLTPTDLRSLSHRCLQSGRVISNVETYEIRGEFDVPRVELSFYGGDAEGRSKTWSERAAESAEFVEWLLGEIAAEPNPIMFQVWLDWPED
jgi:hypothetical protein